MKKLAGLFIVGVIILTFYFQAGRVAGQDQTPVSPGQKPYHPHGVQPIIFDPEQQVRDEAPQSPQDLPDYRKFQNYVYQKVVPGIPTSHGSHWDIFFRPGCGTAVNITNANAQDIDLDLNGSGTSIVFSSERSGAYDIYSMNTAGGEPGPADNACCGGVFPALVAGWQPHRLCLGSQWQAGDLHHECQRQWSNPVDHLAGVG